MSNFKAESCNCGVSTGIRSNHESECRGAYKRSTKKVPVYDSNEEDANTIGEAVVDPDGIATIKLNDPEAAQKIIDKFSGKPPSSSSRGCQHDEVTLTGTCVNCGEPRMLGKEQRQRFVELLGGPSPFREDEDGEPIVRTVPIKVPEPEFEGPQKQD